MILLKITNPTDLVSEKAGKLFANITPEQIDEKIVESQLIKQMLEQLAVEGLEGQIYSVRGIEIKEDELILNNRFKVRSRQNFSPK